MKSISLFFLTILLGTASYAQKIVSQEVMLLDDEPDSIRFSSEYRSFYANKLVDAQLFYPSSSSNPANHVPIGDNLYRVYNGVPKEFKNVIVYAKLTGIADTIVVDTFSLVKAFTSTIVELPFVLGSKDFYTKTGNKISITDSKSLVEELTISCEDVIFKKLTTIKQKTYYKYEQYDTTNPNWSVSSSRRCRHLMGSIANLQYAWSQDFFTHLLYNYSGDLYNNQARFRGVSINNTIHKISVLNVDSGIIKLSGDSYPLSALKIDNPGNEVPIYNLILPDSANAIFSEHFPMADSTAITYYTLADTVNVQTDILDPIFNQNRIHFGFTGGGAGGLGGGHVLGIRGSRFDFGLYEEPIPSLPLFKARTSILSSFPHEFGHIAGFSHNSNITYGTIAGSWVDLTFITFDVLTTENNVIPGIMYNDGQDRIINDKMPFVYPVYIQETPHTSNVDLGEHDFSVLKDTFITIGNTSFNNGVFVNIDSIDLPSEVTTKVSFPISIGPGQTIEIPISINIENRSEDTLNYLESIVVHSQNTLEIPVSITVLPVDAIIKEVVACNEYYWEATNKVYYQTGDYIETLVDANGEDSIVILQLFINGTTQPQIFSETAIKSYTWDVTGLTYDFSGKYQDTLLSTTGCDSVVVLDLIIIDDSVRVRLSSDAEENFVTGSVGTRSSDLELGVDGGDNQYVGLHFRNINVPRNATIYNAKVILRADEPSARGANPYNLNITVQDSVNPPGFSGVHKDVSNRLDTLNTPIVRWDDIEGWDINKLYETSNINPLIQHLVNKPDWDSASNAMALIIWAANPANTRKRVAYSNNKSGFVTDLVFYYTAPRDCSPSTSTDHVLVENEMTYRWIDGNIYTPTNNTATYTLTNSAGCDSIITLDLQFKRVDVVSSCNSYTWIDGLVYTESTDSAEYIQEDGVLAVLNLTINKLNTAVEVEGNTIAAVQTNAQYKWLDCNDNYSIIIDETADSYSPAVQGNFAVEITLDNCVDTSNCIDLTALSLDDNHSFSQIKIYPNPSTGIVNVDLGDLDEATVSLLNVYGQVLQEKKIQNRSYQFELNNESGIYFIKIDIDNSERYFKLIKD